MSGRGSRPGHDGRPRSAPGHDPAGWLGAAILGLVALLGLGALAQPFTWDQAVFALGAERLLAGGRLYVDYWDFKQPGIFWFFALAGRLFGMHELGVHLLELLWLLLLALVLQRTARPWLGPVAAACAPLAVCGFYYAVAGSWHLLQVEGLVGLPLLLSFAAAEHAARGGRRAALAWSAAGAAGGIALLFKLALAPVLVAIWAVPAWDRLAREPASRGRTGAAARLLAALALGALVPLAATLAALARQGGLALAWWTWIVYPAQVMARLHGMPVRNLVATGRWLLVAWPPLLLPAAVGAWVVLRDRGDRQGRALLAWIVAGIGVFLLQRWSGWEYQLFLVLVPLGLLAMRGLETLAASVARRWPDRRPAAAGIVALLLGVGITFAGAIGRSYEVVASGALVDPAAARELLARRSGGAYAHFARLTEFLRSPDAEPGPIYVLGNPLTYWVSGRPPALAMPGGMSIYTAREWAMIARELVAARPPYLLVEDPMAAALAERRDIARPFLDALERYYRPAARMGAARWFIRNP